MLYVSIKECRLVVAIVGQRAVVFGDVVSRKYPGDPSSQITTPVISISCDYMCLCETISS